MDTTTAANISAVAAAFSALFGVLIVVQLALAVREQKRTKNWNRASAAFTFFDNEMFERRELAVLDFLESKGIKFYERRDRPLTREEARQLIEDRNGCNALRNYLNLFEDYAIAIEVGVVDRRVALRQMSDVVTSLVIFYKECIHLIRFRRRNRMQPPGAEDRVYAALLALAEEWDAAIREQGEEKWIRRKSRRVY